MDIYTLRISSEGHNRSGVEKAVSTGALTTVKPCLVFHCCKVFQLQKEAKLKEH